MLKVCYVRDANWLSKAQDVASNDRHTVSNIETCNFRLNRSVSARRSMAKCGSDLPSKNAPLASKDRLSSLKKLCLYWERRLLSLLNLTAFLMPDFCLGSADEGGARRSKRTIVPPLQYWKNERIDYERRKSGKQSVIRSDS